MPQINQRSLDQGSPQNASTVINLAVWMYFFFCKQIAMQIAFVCFLGWFKAPAYPAITHTQRIMFSGMTEPVKPQMNVLSPRQVWFSPGCRAECVRKSIRPLVLITPTYITLQINDTAEKERSIGDKVKVCPLPAHGEQDWDGGWGRNGEPRCSADKTKQVYAFVF